MRAKQYVRIATAANSNISRIEKDTYLRLRRAATTVSRKYANATDIMLRNTDYDS